MLAVSPLTSVKNERESQIQGFSVDENEFQEFLGGNLLDSIDFDDIFVGISDGDVLADLEMDQENIADFSVSNYGEGSEMKLASDEATVKMENENNLGNSTENQPAESVLVSVSGLNSSSLSQAEEIVSKRDESNNPSSKETGKSKKSSAQSKNPPGKKKAKVDWTPELHRQFVQAVEQLGLDKAVPSRILEIMGINCLTRHNIASHLQKYRANRKHVLAREAEAASWSHRRHMYGVTASAGAAAKSEVYPWIAPTMGFPPVAPLPHFRPLYVWGHPSVDQSYVNMTMWHKRLAPPPPPHAWPPPHPLPPSPAADPSFWHPHHQYVATTPGTPCFPPQLPTMRFPSPPVAGVPPPITYRIDPGVGTPAGQTTPRPPSDVHPSKESIDAAIGDVLKKPRLPLPLGLNSPSIDSVMAELKRQGISKIPPTS